MAENYGFTERGARRIVNAVRTVEGAAGRRGRQVFDPGEASSPNRIILAKVTSATIASSVIAATEVHPDETTVTDGLTLTGVKVFGIMPIVDDIVSVAYGHNDGSTEKVWYLIEGAGEIVSLDVVTDVTIVAGQLVITKQTIEFIGTLDGDPVESNLIAIEDCP